MYLGKGGPQADWHRTCGCMHRDAMVHEDPILPKRGTAVNPGIELTSPQLLTLDPGSSHD